jgi:hypothetical protein
MAIAELVSGLQVAGSMAKALVGIRDANLIAEKVIDLRNAIFEAQTVALSAQSEQFALIDRVRNLEEQIRKLEAWEAEKQRYELTAVPHSTAFVYSLKASAQGSEPPHQICAGCYNRGEKSVLQGETRFPGMDRVLVCFNCGADIYTSGERRSEHGSRPQPSRRR